MNATEVDALVRNGHRPPRIAVRGSVCDGVSRRLEHPGPPRHRGMVAVANIVVRVVLGLRLLGGS